MQHHQSCLCGTEANMAADDRGPDILRDNFIIQQDRSKLGWGFFLGFLSAPSFYFWDLERFTKTDETNKPNVLRNR